MSHSRFPVLGAVLCASILLGGFLVSSQLFGPQPGFEGQAAALPADGGKPPGGIVGGGADDAAGGLAASADLGSFPMLETGSQADVREVVQFCREAGPRDVAGLRHAALTSPDPLVVGNALGALGALGAVAGDRELCALLADPRIRVRQEAIVALGRSRDPSVVELLTPFLEESDSQLRPLVIQALGRLDCAAAREALEGYAPGATEQERAFLQVALSPAASLRVERTRVSQPGGRRPVEGNQ